MIKPFARWSVSHSRASIPSSVDSSRRVSVEDLRRIAKRRLPHGVFDYIDGGAEDERSLARNSASFARFEFQPRILRDVSKLDTSTDDLRPTCCPCP